MDLTRLGRRITRALALVVLGLTICSVTVQVLKYGLGHDQLKGMARLFDANEELNIPTWYSVAALLLCAIILAVISFAKRTQRDRFYRHWVGLSIIFLYLSMDEGARIHEILVLPMRHAFHTGGLLYFAWIIPAAFVAVLLGLVYLRFVWHLPKGIRLLVIAAGVIFVGGAFTGEAIGGWYAERYGLQTLGCALIGTAEEFCEMIGVVVFIHALLSHMATYFKSVMVLSFRRVERLARFVEFPDPESDRDTPPPPRRRRATGATPLVPSPVANPATP